MKGGYFMVNKWVLGLLVVLSVSCRNRPDASNRFTRGQIDSLCLDSTRLLQVDAQMATAIDLNRFLEKQSFDFGNRVEEVRLVPLETTGESLVDDIYNIIVTDSVNYIFDDYKRGGVVIFDRNGKFIKRISPGRGPGELYHLQDIAWDAQNKELVAYQHPFLLFYTAAGDFIRQVRLPFGFYNFLVTSDGYIFKTLDKYGNEHLGDKMDNTLLVTDKDFKLRYAGLPAPDQISYGGFNYLYTNEGKIRITQKFNDTIYQYVTATGQLQAEYVLDFRRKKLPARYLRTTSRDFDQTVEQNDYYYFIGEYLETVYHQVFFLRNDHIGLKTVVYRDKRSGHLIGGTSADFNINEIPSIAFPRAASGEYFVSVHYPDFRDSLLCGSSVIPETDQQKIKGMKEDDNPVLVFFRLKAF